jgi:hypothetical protein
VYSEQDAEELSETLISLYVTLASSNKSGELLAADALASLKNCPNEELRKNLKDPARLTKRLFALLNISALENSAKALDLVNDYQNVLFDSRVITDIRPVFGHNVEEAPVGVVVMHNLKLEHIDGRTRKTFYIALDDEDVMELIEKLRRAQKKGRSLSRILEAAKIVQIRTEDQ